MRIFEETTKRAWIARTVAFVGMALLAGFGPLQLARAENAASTTEDAAIRLTAGGTQWPSYNNRLDGQRFSTLSEINAGNAAKLGEACRVGIDGPTSFSAGLIVADGVIYTNTARETVAIDATSCKLLWKNTYVPQDEESVPSSRGPAVMNGRFFRGTGDGRLIALDAKTGKLLWTDVIASRRLNEYTSAAPLAWQGVVYMGVAGSDLGIRGRVMAFDAATGRELWRFNTIPMADDTGADTWKDRSSAKTGGGGVWGAMTLDVTTGELFVPVGNPWPDLAADRRPGANLFTNSIVVLDARTGKLKWWYQATPADNHDLDLSAAPVLYRDSKIRDVVAFAGKDGYVRAVDRKTHELLFQTAITKIENAGVPASKKGVHICPGFAGGVEWNGPTVDRLNKNVVTGVTDWCMTLFVGPVTYDPPNADYGGYPKPDEDARGGVVALDSESGKIQWHYKAEKPVVAGVTPTAGGVIFAGDMGGNFLVLDSKTGKLLKKLPTGGAMAGGLVTYEVDGKQYVAMASGNVSRRTFGVLGLPSVVVMTMNPVPAASSGSKQATSASHRPLGQPDPEHGHMIYAKSCASCHGPDGDMISNHKLTSLRARRDYASTIAFIKDPKSPMPKMFPELLSAQDVADLGAYLWEKLSR